MLRHAILWYFYLMRTPVELLRYALIGGSEYPERVETIMSGEMQVRFAQIPNDEEGNVVVHPDYLFRTSSRTEHAIRGAFALRAIGTDGKPLDELEDLAMSRDLVPDLEHIGGDPVTYKLLGLTTAVNFLEITNTAKIEEGIVSPSETGIEMLEAHPHQAYTVMPTKLHRMRGQDIGGEYSRSACGKQVAAQVYQQYSPHYQDIPFE